MIWIFGIITILSFLGLIVFNIAQLSYNREITDDLNDIQRDVYVLEEIILDHKNELEKILGMSLYAEDIFIRNLLKSTTKTKEYLDDFIGIHFEEKGIDNGKEDS